MWSGLPEPQLGASHGTLVGVHGPATPTSCFSSTCEGPPTPAQPSTCMSIGGSKRIPTFRLQQTAPFGLRWHFFYYF